ncbi:Rne/Rng family ribonuclease [Arthrobacter sp. LAPM80]|uniref:Rne/Rng family ribonuclease n=1 Tax=Arthrobacter sp. LAPM80 TaxID=3141788 RepID=UPI00398B936F
MENEQPTPDIAEAAPAKARATRSRRATAAVTSPGAATKAAAAVETAAETVAETASAPAAAAPAKKAPVRRSRAKKVQDPVAPPIAAAPAAGTDGPSLLDGITEAAAEPAAPAKRATRRRASSPVTAPTAVQADLGVQGELSLAGDDAQTPAVEVPAVETPAVEVPAAKAPAKRTRSAKAPVTSTAAARTATSKAPAAATPATATSEAAVEAETTAVETTAAEPSVEAPAAKAPARRRSRKATAPAGSAPVQAETAVPSDAVAAEAAAEPPVVAQAPAREGAPAKATRSRRRTAAKTTAVEEVPETAAEAPAEQAPAADEAANDEGDAAAPTAASPFLAPSTGMSALFLAPDMSLAVPAAAGPGADDDNESDEGSDNQDGDRRSRNRRNRRARGTDVDAADAVETGDAEDTDADGAEDGVTSRRRRRRRRGDADLELTGGTDEDPPNTVTRVRAPRTPAESTSTASNRVTSLRGSTRLEAKKQRRRDSRDSGRRRTVITEAEFLARRESVDRVMVVRQSEDRIQIGVLEDGILAEHFVSKTQQDSLIGNVYLGKVQNVLPSMEAAFVDIGRGRNAVLYAGEVDWDAANLNGQPRRIENALKSGDTVLVQVSKDPVGHKGARLTSQISLPGRYLVFVPGGSMTGISRKLPDVERNRLKRVLKDHLPENAGVIVRTAAEGASEEELTNDINRLRAQWEGINERASSHKTLAPEMLYGEPDLTIKVVRDVFNEDFTKLIVSGEDAWDTIEAYVTYVAPDLLDRLEKWSQPEDIFAAHRIDEQINKALERKVFLPSGGSLVIDRTEAMTVVDVNTGKFTGSGGNLEETVTKNNLEAAEEVVRQLRLRDIGGIIVIDFIDMVLESNRDLVLRRLVECLGRDRTKHQVAEVTSLGLIQMTRKRMGTGLLEVFGEQCPTCAGRGMVTHEIPVEHRRTHSPAVEVAQVHAPKQENRDNDRTANRSTRSERKRNRNRTQQPETEQHQEIAPAPVADDVSDAQKAQRAHEARAALANIAAAAAASHHEHDGDEHHHAPAPSETVFADASEPADVSDAATLTLGGEAIELPRGHHNDGGSTPGTNNADHAAALAGLAQALDQLAAPGHETSHDSSHESDADAPEAGGGNRSRARRGRRNRSARSAQGGADTAVETMEQVSAGQGSAAHSSAAAAPPVVKKAAEPIILGVGVPASEL